jgi:hypothetical protein
LPVTGVHLARRVRSALLPTVEAYGRCVLNDILPGFSNLDKRANEVAEEEYRRLGALPAGEDCDGDMSFAADAAQEKGLDFYNTMSAMRQATVNLFSAGLFHLAEQKLTDLCADATYRIKPPDTKLDEVAEWYLRHYRVDLRQLLAWPKIEELRLIANAVKHAEGSAARQLRKQRPELFEDPFTKRLFPRSRRTEKALRLPLAGEDLYVTDDMFSDYSLAATDFFQSLAEHFETHGEEQYPDP